MALGDAAALERLVEWCVAGGAGLKHAPCPSTRQVEPAQDMATQQGAGGAPAVRFSTQKQAHGCGLTRFPQRPNFTGLWESDEVEARGCSPLFCCLAEL